MSASVPARFISNLLKDPELVARFIDNPVRREVIELHGLSIVLVLESHASIVIDRYPTYLKDNGIEYLQLVRVGRGKTGKAKNGKPRLLMANKHEIEQPLERWAKRTWKIERSTP